jgi:hypothetical protein
VLQLEQCLTYRDLTYMQLPGKMRLLERVARLQLARQNGIAQDLKHLFGLGEAPDWFKGLGHSNILNEGLNVIDS